VWGVAIPPNKRWSAAVGKMVLPNVQSMVKGFGCLLEWWSATKGLARLPCGSKPNRGVASWCSAGGNMLNDGYTKCVVGWSQVAAHCLVLGTLLGPI
jgi:hypothetical protein